MTYQDRICKYIDLWAELDALDCVINPTDLERTRFEELCQEVAGMISEDRNRTAKSSSEMMDRGSEDDRRSREAVSDISIKVKGIGRAKIGRGVDPIGELAMAFWGLSGEPAGHYARKRAKVY